MMSCQKRREDVSHELFLGGESGEAGGSFGCLLQLKKCEKCAGDCDYLWLSAVHTPLLGPMVPY